VHQIILELTLIDGSILENNSSSLHLVVLELALQSFVEFSVDVFAISFELAIYKISFIPDFSSFGGEDTLASLLAIFEIANVLVFPEIPRFRAFTIFEIFFPISVVDGAGFFLYEDALSMGFTVFPITLIEVTVSLSQTTLSIEHLFSGKSFVYGSIPELKRAKSFPSLHLLSQPAKNYALISKKDNLFAYLMPL